MTDSAIWGMEPKWLEEQLEKGGKSQAELARYLKLAPPIINKMVKGKREIKSREADAIRAFLSVAATSYAPAHGPSRVREELSPAPSVTVPSKGDMALDVPLLGTANGGGGGDFVMGSADGDFVRRPPGLFGRGDVFALFVRGDSMAPRYVSGELIYLERRRPPQNGDHVVVELRADPGGTQAAFLKQLVATTPTKLKLRQYSPDKIVEIERKKVLQVLRVLTTGDMMGV